MNLNATLIAQIIVFLALWWFTAKFVWPPITKALDERSKRIADGLAAARPSAMRLLRSSSALVIGGQTNLAVNHHNARKTMICAMRVAFRFTTCPLQK